VVARDAVEVNVVVAEVAIVVVEREDARDVVVANLEEVAEKVVVEREDAKTVETNAKLFGRFSIRCIK
jgi:hypothetical protein